MTGEVKKPALIGRPPIPDEKRRDRMIRVRATAEEEAKYERLGGAEWFRTMLKRAKVKAP